MHKPARPTRASVARVLERDVLAGCIEACRALGITIARQNTGAMEVEGRRVRFGKKGNSDLSGTINRGVRRGARLAIEAKRPGQRPTSEQLEHLRRVNEDGGVGFWVSDCRDCLRVLQRVLEGGHIETDASGEQWVVWDEEVPTAVTEEPAVSSPTGKGA